MSPFSLPGATWLAQMAAARAIGVAQHDLRIVVQPAPGAERGEVGGELGEFETRHVVGKVIGVRADVAERAARARTFRIDAPFGLLVAGGLGRASQPVLRIFRLNEPDLAKLASADHLARIRRTSG